MSHVRPLSTVLLLLCTLSLAGTAAADEPVWKGDQLVYPEGAEIPRWLTPVEAHYQQAFPPAAARGTATPTGPVHCVAEYEPMAGILIAWEGSSSWLSILAQMARHITTTGDADVYVVVDSTSELTSAQNTLTNEGVNMSRVQFVVRTTDTIWIRDYGPRYIYEGDCRAIVDHTYNRPRPNDNLLNDYLTTLWGHAQYQIPLVHGGGNYHLDALGRSYTTRLINNENPGLTEPEIHDLWADYQNVDTTFFTPFPTTVDLTQHIDMWMQVIADDKVVISDWPNNVGSTQDVICDQAASFFSTRGYTVYRTPARSVSGTHYTYTNVVLCNDLVLIPSYTNSSVSGHNGEALAIWQAALPGKTIVQINAQAIVTAAGVLHCIVMHVPEPLGGANPTVYLRNLRGGESLQPGEQVDIQWISDDDVGTLNVDIWLSTDGGANFDLPIAIATTDDGSHVWTVPQIATSTARVRVVARDAQGNTGWDESEADFSIGCVGDLNGDGVIDFDDLVTLLAAYGASAAGDVDGDGDTDFNDLVALLGAYGSSC